MSDATPPAPGSTATPEPGSSLTAPSVTGLELQADVPRRQVISWALWDWATQPFNSVIITFVFTALYLTRDAFLAPEVAALPADDPVHERALAGLSSGLGLWITISGILIAVLAPVLGQRADVDGRRKAWLGGSTIALVACMFALFFVRADPAYFVLGAVLIALGSVASEIAGVNYNALLVHVSTPKTVGRVSGLGWGLGYTGGILALAVVVVADMFDRFGLSTDDGLFFRVIAVGCAIWAIAFGWPVFKYVPEAPPAADRPRVGLVEGYKVLWRDVVDLYRNARNTFWFLLASAVYRDGLAGVFTFGAIIAGVSFGFSDQGVVIFGIAANLVAGASTMLAGRLDDRIGPFKVIIGSLVGLVIAGAVVVALHDLGQMVFWIAGLLLCCFVGPAQAASRSFLARMTPAGRESEIFGLYAFTGRAASFLAPGLWTLIIALTHATIWGTVGLIAVILAGLALMLALVKPLQHDAAGTSAARQPQP